MKNKKKKIKKAGERVLIKEQHSGLAKITL